MISSRVDIAAQTLEEGGLVAFPTETVFGLGARADDEKAIKKIYELKGRPQNHPLISHCADVEKAFSVAKEVPSYAHALANKFWPGPMTLVFLSNDDGQICNAARGGHESVAVRVPEHKVAQELLSKCDFFVAAPSANKFGRVSPTTAQHVESEFGDELFVLDGEQSEKGIESTIISCLEDEPSILRAGTITQNDIDVALGNTAVVDPSLDIAAPGNLESHYAPSVPVVILDKDSADDSTDHDKDAFIGLNQPAGSYLLTKIPENIDDFAHSLYAFFREAENMKCEKIYVVAPENIGVGIAINDRIKKASHTFGESK